MRSAPLAEDARGRSLEPARSGCVGKTLACREAVALAEGLEPLLAADRHQRLQHRRVLCPEAWSRSRRASWRKVLAPFSLGPTRDLVLLIRGVIGVATPSARVTRIEHLRLET